MREGDTGMGSFEDVLALLHTAVHHYIFAADLDKSAAAGDFVSCADECDFHINAS